MEHQIPRAITNAAKAKALEETERRLAFCPTTASFTGNQVY